MNMLKARFANRLSEWRRGAYREIQSQPARYRIINLPSLMASYGVTTVRELKQQDNCWVTLELKNRNIG